MNERIAVIGAGQMGGGIAHVCSLSGHDVVMIDVADAALEKGRATIVANMERQVKKGSLDGAARDAAVARIATHTSLEAVADCAVVIEAATEHVDLKYRIFEDLDRLAPPDAILATNTSSISITAIGARTGRPESVIGMHFMNPVPVMQLVEVIRGHATTDATTRTVMETAAALGKTPVEVNDYPGFVSNRVLMPMINEAIFCVMESVAAPDAIDTVMKLGMAHPMGPLALADFIGLDVCKGIMTVLHEGLGGEQFRPPGVLLDLVEAGHLGQKTGRGFHSYDEKSG
jgi:3-hydroxybutyryl-CoA dehydrogenase